MAAVSHGGCSVVGCRMPRLPYSDYCRPHHNEFSRIRARKYVQNNRLNREQMSRLMTAIRTMYGQDMSIEDGVALAISAVKAKFRGEKE